MGSEGARAHESQEKESGPEWEDARNSGTRQRGRTDRDVKEPERHRAGQISEV